MRPYWIIILFFLFSYNVFAQKVNIVGKVYTNKGEPLPFATVGIEGTHLNTLTDQNGQFDLFINAIGPVILQARSIGYTTISDTITVGDSSKVEVSLQLNEQTMTLNEVVVTGSRMLQRQTDATVKVNLIDSKTLNQVQACNLADGLRFQPGLRVEVNCQTCNYSQLRMNGLAGGYSQIVVNGRPTFSPLVGLYGLEQLPANQISRIEVVRGGGSVLYGSGAIGGTVNVITKQPTENAFEIGQTYGLVNNQSADVNTNANASVVAKNGLSGISLFLNNRLRQAYDHNSDHFSELPEVQNYSAGASLFFLPKENNKLELSFAHNYEYRYGGDMLQRKAEKALQVEERKTHISTANIDYQLNFDTKSSLILYSGINIVGREHFTGVYPDDDAQAQQYRLNLPTGQTRNLTAQVGTQYSRRIERFPLGANTLIAGAEWFADDVHDQIKAYNYLIDQQVNSTATFLQSDWNIGTKTNLLTGLRLERHSLVLNPVLVPRVAVMHKFTPLSMVRVGWAQGYRAPQAFDADMHIAFAGGGISRIFLSPNLMPETSNSFSASYSFDKSLANYIYGFTIEGFYTHLHNAFYLSAVGADSVGERLEKQNGVGAQVMGTTIELRANYRKKFQAEMGYTTQTSRYNEPIGVIDGLAPQRNFMRTPNHYGFMVLSYTPNSVLTASVNGVYTGTMQVPHFAGAPNQTTDEIINSESFIEINSRIAYSIPSRTKKYSYELSAGVRNLFNSYQRNFDLGPNRDSNFIYGPAAPRTIYVGIKILTTPKKLK